MRLWWREIISVIVLLFIALIFWVLTDNAMQILLSGLTVLLILQFYQLGRLERWLRRGKSGDYPNCKGIWGEVYYHLYRMKKTDKQRKKKLGKMLEQFRKTTAALPDAAVVLGQHDEIEWSNKQALQTLAILKTDKGQRISNLIRNPEFVRYLNSGCERSTLTMPSPVDSNILLEFRAVKYGMGLRLLLAHDVTKIHKMERMRKDFVANVSHELRTPLTVMKGYLETLTDFDEGHSKMLSKSLEQMLDQTVRMEYLVDDLLLLTRLETQQRKLGCVDVENLLRRNCADSDVLDNEEKRIQLKIDTDTRIYGDEQELHSAFSNLLVNALKYSPEESRVVVHWYKSKDSLKLDVKDDGEGIAAKEIPRITERFYRVDVKRSRKLRGTGLGLAIVKHVLMRHEAVLKISSTPGKGSCFSCVFPIKRVCNGSGDSGKGEKPLRMK